MLKIAVQMAAGAGIALALLATVPGDASAQFREFVGQIDQISKKQVRVDNGRGDTMRFAVTGATRVKGQGKTQWKDLNKGDWVSVSWKMTDKSPVAYRVVVMPPRK